VIFVYKVAPSIMILNEVGHQSYYKDIYWATQ